MEEDDSNKKGKGLGLGLDSQLWHACAGCMVQMPAKNSKVYYFPQGHAEHSATTPDFGKQSNFLRPSILCRVVSVKYLADTETDEVYARIRLQPIPDNSKDLDDEEEYSKDSNAGPQASESTSPASFAKTLTQSDANNGGGFSVPRYCAETIFPRLDYSNDPPVQTVLAKDVHGEVWKFRHIYRGTPRRHLLTTGWSTFVNQKKLVAGDAIVFLRSASGELCVGVRRSTRSTATSAATTADCSSTSSCSWHLPVVFPAYRGPVARWGDVNVKGGDGFSGAGFARNRGRVSAKSVVEAGTLAASGQVFEVVYYPRASTPEFCVKAQSVRSALRTQWTAGMRFKMAFETEDSSRISWFMGTVTGIQFADPLHWPNSPWRILQVTWDEPDLLQNVKRVSPWLVEVVSNMPPIQMTPFTLPKKKLRVTQPLDFQLEGKGMMGIQMSTLSNNMLGQINPWHGLSNNVPVGMQGARHDRVYGINLSEFRTNRGQNSLFFDNLYRQEAGVMSPCVSTELNIGNSSQIDQSGVQSSISCLLTIGNSSQSEQDAKTRWTGSTTSKSTPFLLFGKPIHTEQSSKSQQQKQSVLSLSDGLGFYMLSDNDSTGITSNSSTHENQEVFDRVQQLIKGPKLLNNSSLQFNHGESVESAGTNGTRSLQWFKDQATRLRLEKDRTENAFEDNIAHCKVFKETEEVGRTLDLSLFRTYDQLYDRLAKMFGVEESELSNRVLYKGLGGSVKHAGDEPYKDFMKTVRRLTILSDSGSDNMAR